MNSVVTPSPTVSVVMPVYNGERYLADAIDSILGQTFTDFEFIIINDGSTDGTAAILDRYARQDKRIIIVTQENRGIIDTLNRGCAMARGKYIARMDADDVSLPDRFAKQVVYLDQHPDVAALSGSIEVISPEGRHLRIIQAVTNPDTIKRQLLAANQIAHPAVMMRRDAFETTGGYRKAFLHAEDYDLWLRMSEQFTLGNLPDTLLKYRFHPSQIGSVHGEQQAISTIGAQLTANARRQGKPDPSPIGDVINRQMLLDWGADAAIINRSMMYQHIGQGLNYLLCRLDPTPFFDQALALAQCDDDRKWVKTQIVIITGFAHRSAGRYFRFVGSRIALFFINPCSFFHLTAKRIYRVP